MKENVLTKELLLDAIRGKLTLNELKYVASIDGISNKANELLDDTFLLDDFVNTLINSIKADYEFLYIFYWLNFISSILEKKYLELSRYIGMSEMSYEWDGIDFDDVRETIHTFKDYYVKYNNEDYLNYHKNNYEKVIYIRMTECCDDIAKYIGYIVDYKNRKYNMVHLEDYQVDFNIDDNYSFLEHKIYDDDEEWDVLITKEEKKLQDFICDFEKDSSLDL